MKELTVNLDIGHIDAEGVVHTRVVFGRRIDGAALFKLDDNPMGALPTQYGDLLLQHSIVEFGKLKMPIAPTVLLSLDSTDREDLIRAHNDFSLVRDAEGNVRQPEQIGDDRLKLAAGYEAEGIRYDVVEFGRSITGYDQVEAERLRLSPVRRKCFLAGRQIKRLYQSDGPPAELAGPIDLYVFARLDSVDVGALIDSAEVWRHSFRRKREAVQRNGKVGNADGGVHRLERGSDTVAARRPPK